MSPTSSGTIKATLFLNAPLLIISGFTPSLVSTAKVLPRASLFLSALPIREMIVLFVLSFTVARPSKDFSSLSSSSASRSLAQIFEMSRVTETLTSDVATTSTEIWFGRGPHHDTSA